jgi:hypothetical protein
MPMMFTDDVADAFLDSLDADLLDSAVTDDEIAAELLAAGGDLAAMERRATIAIAALMSKRREAWRDACANSPRDRRALSDD